MHMKCDLTYYRNNIIEICSALIEGIPNIHCRERENVHYIAVMCLLSYFKKAFQKKRKKVYSHVWFANRCSLLSYDPY